MKVYCDLHIHSCLSPCADEDMTPQNVCGMARLKGLDMIAVCDHNAALNLQAFKKAARECGLTLVPGIELCTREEIHLLCYFPDAHAALQMSALALSHLGSRKNAPRFFGRQLVVDENDALLDEEEAMLIGATDLSLEKAVSCVRELGGAPVPAHINRGSNGLLTALGFLPPDMSFRCVEIDPRLPCPPVEARVTHSSDAHTLGDIAERDFFIDLADNSPQALLDWMRGR